MPQVIANPEDMEHFARSLKQFNAELEKSMKRLNGQFKRLGGTWRDQEHQKFTREYQQTMRVLHRFQRTSSQQIPFLQRKAQRLRDYLNQPTGDVLPTSSPLPPSASQPSTVSLSLEEATQDQTFQDARGRKLTIRTRQDQDQYGLHVYDHSRSKVSPQTDNLPSQGHGGYAHLVLERDASGSVTRVRLKFIETGRDYRKAGVGSRMLSQVEAIGRASGASEIYGLRYGDQATREWYVHRGYAFRKDGLGREEVVKVLS